MQPLAVRQVARDKDMDAHHHFRSRTLTSRLLLLPSVRPLRSADSICKVPHAGHPNLLYSGDGRSSKSYEINGQLVKIVVELDRPVESLVIHESPPLGPPLRFSYRSNRPEVLFTARLPLIRT